LKRAAQIQERGITDFVVAAVAEAAQQAIERTEVMRLSLSDQQCFVKALLHPPKQAPALERILARSRKLLRQENE